MVLTVSNTVYIDYVLEPLKLNSGPQQMNPTSSVTVHMFGYKDILNDSLCVVNELRYRKWDVG